VQQLERVPTQHRQRSTLNLPEQGGLFTAVVVPGTAADDNRALKQAHPAKD